jgi:hypothetical protein
MDLPPYENMCQVLDKCPEAFFLYSALWKRQDENTHIIINKKSSLVSYETPMEDMSEQLAELQKAEVLTFDELKDTWIVRVMKKHSAEGRCLC